MGAVQSLPTQGGETTAFNGVSLSYSPASAYNSDAYERSELSGFHEWIAFLREETKVPLFEQANFAPPILYLSPFIYGTIVIVTLLEPEA